MTKALSTKSILTVLAVLFLLGLPSSQASVRGAAVDDFHNNDNEENHPMLRDSLNVNTRVSSPSTTSRQLMLAVDGELVIDATTAPFTPGDGSPADADGVRLFKIVPPAQPGEVLRCVMKCESGAGSNPLSIKFGSVPDSGTDADQIIFGTCATPAGVIASRNPTPASGGDYYVMTPVVGVTDVTISCLGIATPVPSSMPSMGPSLAPSSSPTVVTQPPTFQQCCTAVREMATTIIGFLD